MKKQNDIKTRKYTAIYVCTLAIDMALTNIFCVWLVLNYPVVAKFLGGGFT